MALSISCCASLRLQLQNAQLNTGNYKCGLEKVKNLIAKTGIPSIITSPHESLQKGNWVKLICGASFEDVADIRNLSLVYTLAGVDCIDCAAEASIVDAVNEGIEAARDIVPMRRPWVMISVNDDEDLHFRKAGHVDGKAGKYDFLARVKPIIEQLMDQINGKFDPDDCPLDCPRPCENVCPANAILQERAPGVFKGGVLAERCYGCGRCLPICPYDKIRAITYKRDVSTTAELLRRYDVDAIEIHTSGRQAIAFENLWSGLGHSITNLKLVAVSMPDIKDLTIAAMSTLYSIMEGNLCCDNLWQLDGRPMSGDIGRGTTREAIAFALHLSSARDRPKGFLQLAGGTNAHTIEGLKKEKLFQTTTRSASKWKFLTEKSKNERAPSVSSISPNALIGGVAFGGYARKIVGRVLTSMQSQHGYACIEDYPEHLLKALVGSLSLVGTVKSYSSWNDEV